jgi:hypothetical protein
MAEVEEDCERRIREEQDKASATEAVAEQATEQAARLRRLCKRWRRQRDKAVRKRDEGNRELEVEKTYSQNLKDKYEAEQEHP